MRFALLLLAVGMPLLAQEPEQATRTVRAKVQPRPGAEVVAFDMPVHEVPVDPPLVAAGEAGLADGELVLGIETDGEAVAFPIRALARFEVLNGKVGKLPVAPTW